ncbi:unnamed protein product [Urochloa humidicola]
MDGVDLWASLPDDLLVSIFLLVDTTAVVRSAGACRPWRRAIIRNATRLGPRPALLLGFFHRNSYVHHPPVRRSNVLTATQVDWTNYTNTTWSYQATVPLSSRDGFVLLAGGSGDYMRLCDAVTGRICRFIPAAALDDVSVDRAAAYVLITSHDIVSPGGGGVWILAVKQGEKENVKPGMTYQIFSPASGEWGPIKTSARFGDGRAPAYRYGEPKDVAVCRGGVVHWLGEWIKDGRHRHGTRRVTFALDVLTERAWTTELPEKYLVLDRYRAWRYSFALATTAGDGRLSLIASLRGHKIEVWVLDGDGLWTLRRTVDVHGMLPLCHQRENDHVSITVFCPRSRCLFGHVRCLFGHVMDQYLFIPVDGDSSPCLMKTFKQGRVSCYPYDMDWSTYISRMKYF